MEQEAQLLEKAGTEVKTHYKHEAELVTQLRYEEDWIT